MENPSGILALLEVMNIKDPNIAQKLIAEIKSIASTTNTLEELFTFEHQIDDILEQRRIDEITPILNNIENDSHINPNSVMAWNQIKKTLSQHAMFALQVALAVSANNKQRLAEKEGISVDVANETNRRSATERIDSRKTIYEYASRILEKMIYYYNEKITIHDIEFQSMLRIKLGVETVLITEMLEYIIPSDDSAGDTNVNWLLSLAQCYHFMLEAHLFHDDKAYSFMIKGREEALQKLSNIYARIDALEPSFETPELPDLAGINIPEEHTTDGNRTQQTTQNNGGCYIATAVYGSYDCPQVWTLRRFRDNILASTWYGRLFIRTYYAVSPTFVKCFGNCKWFKVFWLERLDKLVNNLHMNGVESTPYEDKVWQN